MMQQIQRHTVSPIQCFAPTVESFQHVDLVGPLPPSFLHLHLVISPSIATLDGRRPVFSVAKRSIANWISRFGVPVITLATLYLPAISSATDRDSIDFSSNF
ncbi:hypothetical protein TNCV_1414721 [Trichonephila clavipes]|nr:hypothetical protein TNCV_1414721 [Trichonephila clavipes]